MTKKEKFVAVVALVAVLFVGATFPINDGPSVVERVVEKTVGAMPGNRINSDEFFVGDYQVVRKSSGLLNSTTTVCVFQSPNGTSTLTFASILFNTSTTTASQGLWSKGSTMGASTTALSGVRQLAASEQALVFASTTDITDATRSRLEIAPNQWVKFSMQSTDAVGVFSPVGACRVEFVVSK